MYQLVAPILAQIREDTEVMLASSLDVFAGTGTPEENLYVGLTVIAGGLIAMFLAINFTIFFQKLTLSVLVKIFTMWLIFAAGVTAITIPNYMAQKAQYTPTQADESARPYDVAVFKTDETITITWQTQANTYGYVKYRADGAPPVIAAETIIEPRIDHAVVIPRDVYTQSFEFVIISEGVEYRQNGTWLSL